MDMLEIQKPHYVDRFDNKIGKICKEKHECNVIDTKKSRENIYRSPRGGKQL